MIQKPKGTYDVYSKYGKKLIMLEYMLKELMEIYNYEYTRTPIFEASELFHRTVGEASDIVSKETYDFLDRGNRKQTLRPEGTAGVVRSFIENKRYGEVNQPIKTWYYGPMYRYERPQSGRFREFYQFGVEVFGSSDPMIDVEVISIPVNLYKALGLKEVKVNINSLGDKETRERYHQILVDYFKPHIKDLCEDCQNRFTKNPLRILDCKIDNNSDIIKNAPKTLDYLNENSKKHFDEVIKYLDALQIEYTINKNLVRGLDYYTHTVFEVEANIEGFGSQNVLCGGGRYDNLVSSLGGPNTEGVGFALGIERLLLALDKEKIELPNINTPDLYIIPLSPNEKEYAFKLLMDLRTLGFSAEIDYMNRNLKSNFKQSERLGANFLLLIGEEEVKKNIVTIKNNHTKKEAKVKFSEITDYIYENSECDCCSHKEE